MDYLRTLGSAAVSSLVQKSGLNLPFSLGPKVTTSDTLYNLYDGTKRDDGSTVSIFEYDLSDPSKKNIRPLAQNALRKLRTTRHPDVLKFMDAVESETMVYIMTERVRPLPSLLSSWSTKNEQERQDWLLWGLHRISIALTFLNDPCGSTHGNINLNAIFISPSGEWKLGGLETLSNPKDDAAVLYTLGGLLPGSSSWASPEVRKSGWSTIKQHDPSAADGYCLGLLLHSVFNPSHSLPATIQPPHSPPTASSRGLIPLSIFPLFKKLLNPNPATRMAAKSFLEVGMSDSGFFATNRLVKVCLGLDNFTLGSESEKNSFLRTLQESASAFPPEFASYRVLPSLLSALEFGGASAAAILPLVIQFGVNVTPEEYPNVILTPLVKLYASPDRGTRMALLEHLPEYVEKLDKKVVSDKVFPHLQTGFSDTVAVVREATVKSISLLAPKLSDRLLNNELLRLLAKMQMDPEPSIRTNTCILLGRLGPSLGHNTKKKVLVPAFSRALKDSFVHARVAGLMAFMATIDCFDVEDIATKVIPNISFTMIDKEKLVRDQAFKALDLFLKKLEVYAASMPETAATTDEPVFSAESGLPVPGALVHSAAGAAGMLAGWAISSLGKKLATSELQSTINPSAGRVGLPPTNGSTTSNGKPSSPALLTSYPPPVPRSSLSPLPSKSKGLQLGASKTPSLAADAFAEQLAEEAAVNETNPWGTDDLIDVNADEGDWSAFEAAPIIAQPTPVSAGATNFGLRDQITRNKQDTKDAVPAPLSQKSIPHPQTPVPGLTVLSTLSPSHSGGSKWDEASEWESSSSPAMQRLQTPPMLGSLTKEEKATEMARRKEERKQRIAMLKEQKKNLVKS